MIELPKVLLEVGKQICAVKYYNMLPNSLKNITRNKNYTTLKLKNWI